MTRVLEAYDWIRFADQYGEKLEAAAARLEEHPDRDREKAWMRSCVEMLAEARAACGPIADRMRMLPEMSAAREDYAAQQVGPWVDALEKLLAGITFHFGSRAPVIEALFPHQKLVVLRRGNLDEVRAFATELERRLKSSYVERIFAQEEYAFAREVVAAVRAAYAVIGASAEAAPLSEKDRSALSSEAIEAAASVERAVHQARLIAEASLIPLEGAFAEAGLNAKPKKRTAKVSESDLPQPIVEAAPEVEPELEPEPEPIVEAKPATKKKRSKKSAEAASEV